MRWRGSALKIIAVALSGLMLGACSGSGGGEPEAPPPISLQQYETTLAGAVDPLQEALKGLAAAKAYKGLEGRVKAVEDAGDQAVTELTDITPPVKLAPQHAQLVTALEAFHEELGGLTSQVDERALCTGSAVRTGLGNATATAGLHDALVAVSGELPGDPPPLTLPAAGQKLGARPENGKILRGSKLDGEGELIIKNGGSDAVVTLSKKGKTTASVFVRKDKQATVTGVPDGSYTVFFTSGAGWDGKVRAFGRSCSFQRSEKKSKFVTTAPTLTKAGSRTVFTYTLYAVVGGNAPTKDVDPGDFPDS